MKKAWFFTFLLGAAVFSFGDENIHNKYIYIEGTADRADHLAFFMANFNIEAGAAGYIVTGSRSEASHTFKFDVKPNFYVYDISRYVIYMSLISNSDNFEILSYSFFFTELDEMYDYNQSLFQMASVYIPPLTEDDLVIIQPLDNRWKNKWMYFRLSFDYPITFYLLQNTGLIGPSGLYKGPYDAPEYVTSLDHKVMAMPGLTAGLEFQFLNFLSLELNYQLSMGDTRDNSFINMAAGAELKFPFRFQNIMLTPYGTFLYPLSISPIFNDFPDFSFGAGIQLSARGGTQGAFFVDVKYMLSLGDTIMRNPYLDFPAAQQLAPNPSGIYYNRSIIGIGVGYKFGFLDRQEGN